MLPCGVCHIYKENQYLTVFTGLFQDRNVPSYEKMFTHVHKRSTLHPSRHFLSPPGAASCLSRSHSVHTPTFALHSQCFCQEGASLSHPFSHLHKPCIIQVLCFRYIEENPYASKPSPLTGFSYFPLYFMGECSLPSHTYSSCAAECY